MKPLVLPLLLLAAGCAAPAVPPAAPPPVARPLDTLPGDAALSLVRADLLATARAVHGAAALDRALAATAHLIAKRFIGFAPPPPPGAGPEWRPPTPSALMIREGGRWLVHSGGHWRAAADSASVEIDRLLAAPRLWSEPATVPACPDFGATNLLLKVPGRAETVRSAQCSSATADLVQAALGA